MSLTTSEKLQLIGDTWNFESTGVVPYTIEIGQPHFATNEFFEDDAAELAWHEAYHDQRHEVIDFDMPNIKPNLGIGTIAAAFGWEPGRRQKNKSWRHHPWAAVSPHDRSLGSRCPRLP